MYLSVCTRLDIAYTVGCLARFSSKPNRSHWTAAKRLLRYLKGTADCGIAFTRSESEECIGFSDADWAGDQQDRRSTSGYLFLMAGGPVSWKSKRQDVLLCPRQRLSIWHSPLQLKRRSGSDDFLQNLERNLKDQQFSWKITNLPLPRPKNPNSTAVPNTSTSVTTSSGRKSTNKTSNSSIVPLVT